MLERGQGPIGRFVGNNSGVTPPATISVCMATFNGAAYVTEQLVSILAQLGPDDEVVVVDDASRDDTVATVQALQDPRVVVHRNEVNLGYAAAFESAVTRATGDLLMLADQDDIWPDGRVELMRAALVGAAVVAGSVEVLGSGQPLRGPFGQHEWRLPEDPAARGRILIGLGLSNVPYFGSAMALRRDVLPVVLPYPACARELPDAWIAINALLDRSMAHLPEVVVLRRVHGANATGRRRALPAVLRGRILFLRMLAEAKRRRRQRPGPSGAELKMRR